MCCCCGNKQPLVRFPLCCCCCRVVSRCILGYPGSAAEQIGRKNAHASGKELKKHNLMHEEIKRAQGKKFRSAAVAIRPVQRKQKGARPRPSAKLRCTYTPIKRRSSTSTSVIHYFYSSAFQIPFETHKESPASLWGSPEATTPPWPSHPLTLELKTKPKNRKK